MAARAAVEALLRERKLDRTLTSTLPERLGEDAVAPLDNRALDRALAGRSGLQDDAVAGGLPRGQVSEVVGPASSGRTSVAWAALAAATRRGESVALIDTFDRFDPPTAHACGIDLSRLLWVRGQAVSKTSGAIDPAWLPGVRAVSGPGTFVERVIDRAIKSLNLVVQSGVCTLVVMDLIDLPATALRRLPASTWFRVERAIEGSDTAVLILAAQPVARSAGGRSIVMGELPTSSADPGKRSSAPGKSHAPDVIWKGDHDRTRRIAGVHTRANITAARSAHGHYVDVETTVVNAV
jgi:recA bacterial DNA recombination protein